MNYYNILNILFIYRVIKNESKIKSLFEHHFFKNQYYLHKSASESHMSSILNINTAHLNQLTTKYYQLDFNDLCEKYKLEHFWIELSNPLNSELPIYSLINASGFKSEKEFSNLILNHREESKKLINSLFF